jgi:hypothetical protein
VQYPATLGSDEFEKAISVLGMPLPTRATVEIDHRQLAFAPLDVLVSALYLYNELARKNDVVLHWESQQQSFKYAERMGFFNLLDEGVAVAPERPNPGSSLYDVHQQNNRYLVEMTAIERDNTGTANDALDLLRTRLAENLQVLPTADDIVDNIWTFAAESLGNIYEHSQSPVPGIVAAQRYSSTTRGARLHLVIADGGLGIPATIRSGNPAAAREKTDVEIIYKAFRDGLSRRVVGGHGCGLTTCARIALRYQGNLRIRVGSTWAKLIAKSARTGLSLGFFEDEATPISGTHVSLDFYLDRLEEAA